MGLGGGVLLGILGGVVLAGSPNPDPISGAALKQGIRNPESGNGNGNGIRNQISMIVN